MIVLKVLHGQFLEETLKGSIERFLGIVQFYPETILTSGLMFALSFKRFCRRDHSVRKATPMCPGLEARYRDISPSTVRRCSLLRPGPTLHDLRASLFNPAASASYC